MTEALRRLLWFLPVLIAGAVLLFLALGQTSTVAQHLKRPLLYNAAPVSADLAAQTALSEFLASARTDAPELVKLGGAALPIVLASIDTMPVDERRRVARALWPLAERMGLSRERSWGRTTRGRREHELSADEQLLFWERYREEHALDLRPLAVARLVKRMAARDSRLRNPDLMAVDTYALPTLVNMLGRVRSREDLNRVRRLLEMISHVTGKEWRIRERASLHEAQIQATQVRRFWDEEGPKFSQLSPLELLVARFSQTEFTMWVERSVREVSGIDTSPIRRRFTRAGQLSWPLLVVALLGMLFVGPVVTATIQVLQLQASRFRLDQIGLRLGLATALVAIVPLLVTERSVSRAQMLLATFLMGTLHSVFILHRELNDKVDWRTHHILRERGLIKRIAAVARWLVPSLPTLTPIAIAEAAVWITCIEVAGSQDGLGRTTLTALRTGDLYWLMTICLALGVATALAQVFADLFLGDGELKRQER